MFPKVLYIYKEDEQEWFITEEELEDAAGTLDKPKFIGIYHLESIVQASKEIKTEVILDVQALNQGEIDWLNKKD